MTDIFSPEKRRSIMQSVRRRGTDPEQRLAAMLERLQIPYTTNVESLTGKPDFYFENQRIAVFVQLTCPLGMVQLE